MEAWYNKSVHFVKFDQYPMTPQIHPLPDSYKDWYLSCTRVLISEINHQGLCALSSINGYVITYSF